MYGTGLSIAERRALRLDARARAVEVPTVRELLARHGVEVLARAACDATFTTLAAAMGRSRFPHVVCARHAIWALLGAAGVPFAAIGRAWGVHHTTVMAGIVRHNERKNARG